MRFVEDLDQEPDEGDLDDFAKSYTIDEDQVKWMNSQLYHILAQKTSNSPLQTVKNLGEELVCRGASAWSKIEVTGLSGTTIDGAVA